MVHPFFSGFVSLAISNEGSDNFQMYDNGPEMQMEDFQHHHQAQRFFLKTA
jgi:hypothetical protein